MECKSIAENFAFSKFDRNNSKFYTNLRSTETASPLLYFCMIYCKKVRKLGFITKPMAQFFSSIIADFFEKVAKESDRDLATVLVRCVGF